MPSNHQSLSLLTLCYTVIMILANWFDPRLISVFGFTTDAGTIVFPLTFLLSDLITEVYGYKYARRAVWCGFLFNIIFILYGQIVIHLPSPAFAPNNQIFDQLLATNTRIIFASIISYLCAEPTNAFLMAKLKIKMNGKNVGFRFVLSSLFASGIDSFVFASLAFYASIPNIELIKLIFTMWFVKVAIECIGLPLSIRLANKLKQQERLDIYDRDTNFNPFRIFDVNYRAQANEFEKELITT